MLHGQGLGQGGAPEGGIALALVELFLLAQTGQMLEVGFHQAHGVGHFQAAHRGAAQHVAALGGADVGIFQRQAGKGRMAPGIARQAAGTRGHTHHAEVLGGAQADAARAGQTVQYAGRGEHHVHGALDVTPARTQAVQQAAAGSGI